MRGAFEEREITLSKEFGVIHRCHSTKIAVHKPLRNRMVASWSAKQPIPLASLVVGNVIIPHLFGLIPPACIDAFRAMNNGHGVGQSPMCRQEKSGTQYRVETGIAL